VDSELQSVPGRAEVDVDGGRVTMRLSNTWRRAYSGSAALLALDIVSQIAAASATRALRVLEAEPCHDVRSLIALSSPSFAYRVLTVCDRMLSQPTGATVHSEYASPRREVVATTTDGRVTGLVIDPEWATTVSTQKLNETLTGQLDRVAAGEQPSTVDLDAVAELQAEAAALIASAGV
jgi:hypothetical protein